MLMHDKVYGPQHSQALLLTRLPFIEVAYSMLQQEELQSDALAKTQAQVDASTLLRKG